MLSVPARPRKAVAKVKREATGGQRLLARPGRLEDALSAVAPALTWPHGGTSLFRRHGLQGLRLSAKAFQGKALERLEDIWESLGAGVLGGFGAETVARELV